MARVFIVLGDPRDEEAFRVIHFTLREPDELDLRIREAVTDMAEQHEPEPGCAQRTLERIRRACIEKSDKP